MIVSIYPCIDSCYRPRLDVRQARIEDVADDHFSPTRNGRNGTVPSMTAFSGKHWFLT